MPGEASRPSLLFHYTSLETFDKILRSGSLRLYSERTMNDISEGTWIEPGISRPYQCVPPRWTRVRMSCLLLY